MIRRSLMLALLLPAWGASAHDVIHQITQGDATVVSVGFADGHPLDFSAYEVYRGDETIPYAVGRTDAVGRVVFIPDRTGPWRVKVWSDDGHGGDFNWVVSDIDAPNVPPPAPTPRWQILLTGISWIFGIFGLLILLQRRSPR